MSLLQPPPVSFEKYRRGELLAAAQQIGYIALVCAFVAAAVILRGAL